MDNTVLDIIKKEFHLRVIQESLTRIDQCLGHLSLEELWHKENDNTNAIGNLVLHLEGNIRQYIISGVGMSPDIRMRNNEFSSEHLFPKEVLMDKLSLTLYAADAVVSNLSQDQLAEAVIIQGFSHTRLSAIIHVIEHLSYHVGQITYYTKYIKDIDTAYYGGLDLDVTE